MATKISQREAVRLRREVRRLRDFLHRIRFSAGLGVSIGTVTICDLARGRIQGVRALEYGAVLVVTTPDSNGNVTCFAHVPPKELA